VDLRDKKMEALKDDILVGNMEEEEDIRVIELMVEEKVNRTINSINPRHLLEG
jgi:hypothetical protein